MPNGTRSLERLETRKCLFESRLPAPMQEVKVDAIGLEPLQAALASGDGCGLGRILRQHLAHDEAFIAPPGHRLCHDRLGAASAVHLGGVDQRQPEIKTELERGNFIFACPRALAHAPGALAELRHFLAARKFDLRKR
jgi:hypothetical protein